MNSVIVLIGRILLSVIFILRGLRKADRHFGHRGLFRELQSAWRHRCGGHRRTHRVAGRAGHPRRLPDPHRGLGDGRFLRRHSPDRSHGLKRHDAAHPLPEEPRHRRRLPGAGHLRPWRTLSRCAPRLDARARLTIDIVANIERPGRFPGLFSFILDREEGIPSGCDGRWPWLPLRYLSSPVSCLRRCSW